MVSGYKYMYTCLYMESGCNGTNHSALVLRRMDVYINDHLSSIFDTQGDLKQFLLATSKETELQLTIDPPDTAQKLNICHQVSDKRMDSFFGCFIST